MIYRDVSVARRYIHDALLLRRGKIRHVSLPSARWTPPDPRKGVVALHWPAGEAAVERIFKSVLPKWEESYDQHTCDKATQIPASTDLRSFGTIHIAPHINRDVVNRYAPEPKPGLNSDATPETTLKFSRREPLTYPIPESIRVYHSHLPRFSS